MKILAAVAPDTESATEKSPPPKPITEPDPWYMPPAPLDETQRRLFRERTGQAAFWHSSQNQHSQAFDYRPSTHLSPRL
jgi:hypothetical protein